MQQSKATLQAHMSSISDGQCPEGCAGSRRRWLNPCITCCSSIVPLLLGHRSVQKVCWLVLLLLLPPPSAPRQGPLLLLLTAGHQRGEQPRCQPRQEFCIFVGRPIVGWKVVVRIVHANRSLCCRSVWGQAWLMWLCTLVWERSPSAIVRWRGAHRQTVGWIWAHIIV